MFIIKVAVIFRYGLLVFLLFFSILPWMVRLYIVTGEGDLAFYSSKTLQHMLISPLVFVLGCFVLYNWQNAGGVFQVLLLREEVNSLQVTACLTCHCSWVNGIAMVRSKTLLSFPGLELKSLYWSLVSLTYSTIFLMVKHSKVSLKKSFTNFHFLLLTFTAVLMITNRSIIIATKHATQTERW